MQKTTPLVCWIGGIADLPLLKTLLAIHQKSLGSEGLFCFSSICKFGSFKNPLATITILSEFYFRFRRFILLVQKKVISMNYGDSTNCWKSHRWSSRWWGEVKVKEESAKRKPKAKSMELMVVNMQFSSFAHSIKWAKQNLPRDTVQKKVVVKAMFEESIKASPGKKRLLST